LRPEIKRYKGSRKALIVYLFALGSGNPDITSLVFNLFPSQDLRKRRRSREKKKDIGRFMFTRTR